MSREPDHDDQLLPTLVRASAGTGKTYQLTARFLKLLTQGVAPETILATTFTRKAAGEILNRILKSLSSAASSGGDDALAEIREQVKITTLRPSFCLQLTEKLLQNIHRLRVSTLDSLFTQLAKSFPYELQLPATWRLSDEIEDVWLRERAVAAMISQLEQSEMATLLSMLGKGEVRRSIASELLQVIDVAYTKQRSCEENVWLHVRAPKRPTDAEIKDAIALFRQANPKQKRLKAKLEAFADALEVGDDDCLVLDTVVSKYHETQQTGEPLTYYRSEFPEGLESAFATVYAIAKCRHLSLLQMQNEGTGKLLAAYEKHIGQSKEDSRVLSFEDVAVRLSDLFRQRSPATLLAAVDGVVDHLLLDEFQDTSPTQWQVLFPFAERATEVIAGDEGESSSDLKTARSFFCVGDTKQAIYGWRGGVAEIFDQVADQLPRVVEVKQNKSYRSSPVIMSTVTAIFKNLSRHSVADDARVKDPSHKPMYEARALLKFADSFPEHVSAKEQLAGYVQYSTAALPEGADALIRRTATFEKASEIAEELLAKNPSLSIGVLTRTNRAVAELIFLMEQKGIDVSQEGGNPLIDSAAVEMVLSALMMAEHPGDGRWEFHLRGGPLSEVEGLDAQWVRRRVDEVGLAETIHDIANHLAPHCDARETLRLKQLTYLAIGHDFRASPRLRDFVRMVREKRVDRPRSAPVRVMTVHQAKGLEFDAVIVVEMDSALSRQSSDCVAQVKDLMSPPVGLSRYVSQKTWHFLSRDWQAAFGKQAADAFTESLCMWYVAITRAKQGLYMVVSPSKKADFDARTFGSLVFHALGCEQDPTQENVILFEHGEPEWYTASAKINDDGGNDFGHQPQPIVFGHPK